MDGGQHALPDEILKDRQRDAWLEKEGYTVVRFWDNEALTNTSGVLEAIGERLHRTPSPQGRGSNYPHKMRKNLICITIIGIPIGLALVLAAQSASVLIEIEMCPMGSNLH